MASKRKAAAMNTANEEPVDPSDELLFLALGGGNEVGRSCHIIQYKGKTVMVSYCALRQSEPQLTMTFSSTPVNIPHTMASLRSPSTTTSISAPSMCYLSASKRFPVPKSCRL